MKLWLVFNILHLHFVLIFGEKTCHKKKPNIVIIMADDMGFNDVSFNGQNQFITPNLDALAYNGIILNKHYTPPMCSPSRTAFLTGKYPIRTGMQHFVMANDDPWGLCPNEILMSHVFKANGYSTNLVGKWHLGYFKKVFTPLYRGFDHHYGYMGGYIDYWDHSVIMLDKNYSRGYDFYNDLKINYRGRGQYATDLFTNEAIRIIENHGPGKKPLFLMVNHLAPHTGNENDPMQAPLSEINKFQYIKDEKRRKYAAMVSKLDKSVGLIVKALSNRNMLCNTIILFYSDNGAPTQGLHSNSGSNFPFRSQKNSPFEGAIRVPAILYSPLLNQRSYVSKQLIHLTDWFPTLASAAGIKIVSSKKLDGIDLWDNLSNAKSPISRKILHNIDEIFGYSSYLEGDWKYVNYTTSNGKYDNFLGRIGNELDPRTKNYYSEIMESDIGSSLNKGNQKCSTSTLLTKNNVERLRYQAKIKCPIYPLMEIKSFKCKPLEEPCLFNLNYDPCERYNFAKYFSFRVKAMQENLKSFRKELVPSVYKMGDKNANPALHNGTWTWWVDDTYDIGIPGTYCKGLELDIRYKGDLKL
ncbi:arylsulfatase B-like [Condylostylus longicornis]|uniref:arylsulfatase B-like n=1 Tax=Condylostylus longicornis TaxID=2530218 RepID=UPI00244DD901|nr:arylsulfatase B-like [Condylostylus longicornis]